MLYRAYLFSVCLSIISCAISVSISQLFLILAFLCFLFLKNKPNFRSEILLLLLLLYSWQIFSMIYHVAAESDMKAALFSAWKGELKDIFLLSAFFVVQAVKEEDKPKLTKAFVVFAFLILITGFVAIFSSIRLSRLISDLYRTSSTWPYQHHYGNIFHLPIGLMNTHLTFGGLIAFVTPYFFFTVYHSWKKNQSIFLRLFHVSLFLILMFIFLLNNARSAMLGAFFSVSFGLYYFLILEKEISTKVLRYLVIGFSAMVLLVSVAYFQSPYIKKLVQPLFGSEKHTDSGRTFIWDSTFPLILESPIFGIGPGSYPKEIERSRKQKEVEHPELAYFYEVTQRGHSHNDYFHLAVIYGIPATLFYFLLGVWIVYGFTSKKIPEAQIPLTLGLTGFFLSGLLQCYFQDDEVLIVFFFLLGYYQMFWRKGDTHK